MPTTYVERLNLPPLPQGDVKFMTVNGLPVATGYNRIIMTGKGPMIEFSEDHMVFENVGVPETGMWRQKHPEAYYVEHRSRDYCNVKIFEQKRVVGDLQPGFWYISALDLISDKYPVLVEPSSRKNENRKVC